MYPSIHIGPSTFNTYGFCVCLGFLAAMTTAKKLARISKVNVQKISDLGFWSLMLGALGSRLLYALTQPTFFLNDPLSIFRFWEGGLVFLGGPIIVIPFLAWYSVKNQLQPWKTLDIGTPPLVIGHAFGRLGCFSVGCCYGKPTSSWFGITSHSLWVESALRGVPLHPTQLYEAGALFFLFVGLMYLFKRKRYDAQVALTYLFMYPIIRCSIEIFRGDIDRGFVLNGLLSTSQLISILVFIGTIFLFRWRMKQLSEEKSNRSNKQKS